MKWLLAGLMLLGVARAQDFKVIGPATTLQELLYSAPFPEPTYKVDTKDCFDFLMKALGMKNAKYEGDEVTVGDTTSRLVCYASDLPQSEIASYVFDFTQTLREIDFNAYEMRFESTDLNTTSQFWSVSNTDYLFMIRYYTYAKGLLIFASIDQPTGEPE